jgi:type VI secretion system secreted protein VgrG
MVTNPARVRARLQVGDGAAPAVRRMEIDEELSGASVLSVAVGADGAPDVPWLGCSAALELWREQAPEGARRFCGVVRAVEQGWGMGQRAGWHLRIEPGFACLDEDRLTRPFVGLSAVEILRQVLPDALAALGGREVDFRLPEVATPAGGARGGDLCADGFPRRELCVQYGESTYAFCRRLMAEEGLAHLYDHAGAVEKLIVMRGSGPFDRLEPALPLARPHAGHAPPESVRDVMRARTAAVGAADCPRLRGKGDVLALAPGALFALSVAPDQIAPDWLGGDLLLAAVRHVAELPEDEAAGQAHGTFHDAAFACLPAGFLFRPAPIARPAALEDWGIVVSRSTGDPIDADPQGRVRVRFLYDRRPDVDAAQRSPFIPVTQAWAGAGFGTQILPRAGMLVRLEYAGGDPDRPVIADAFPTAENTVPATLPDRKSRVVIRTRSLRAGAGASAHRNQITLDDAAGAEEIAIRAGHGFRRRVLHDEQTSVDHDESRTVSGAQHLEVQGRRTRTVGASESVQVGGTRVSLVAGSDERTVTGPDAEVVGGLSDSTVSGARLVAVTGLETSELRAGRAVEVTGEALGTATGTRAITGDVALHARQGGSEISLAAGSALVRPDRALCVRNGPARLAMDPPGHATLQATTLALACGSSRLTLADGKIVLRAKTVVARGADGRLRLDDGGASTRGKKVHSSAVVLNRISGMQVIFSDAGGGS